MVQLRESKANLASILEEADGWIEAPAVDAAQQATQKLHKHTAKQNTTRQQCEGGGDGKGRRPKKPVCQLRSDLRSKGAAVMNELANHTGTTPAFETLRPWMAATSPPEPVKHSSPSKSLMFGTSLRPKGHAMRKPVLPPKAADVPPTLLCASKMSNASYVTSAKYGEPMKVEVYSPDVVAPFVSHLRLRL